MPDINLADIAKIVADYQPTSDPFNGATRVLLDPVSYDKIAPLMTAIDRRRIAVEMRPALPPGSGVGFRPARDDDHEWQIVPGYGTLVWTMGPTQS